MCLPEPRFQSPQQQAAPVAPDRIGVPPQLRCLTGFLGCWAWSSSFASGTVVTPCQNFALGLLTSRRKPISDSRIREGRQSWTKAIESRHCRRSVLTGMEVQTGVRLFQPRACGCFSRGRAAVSAESWRPENTASRRCTARPDQSFPDSVRRLTNRRYSGPVSGLELRDSRESACPGSLQHRSPVRDGRPRSAERPPAAGGRSTRAIENATGGHYAACILPTHSHRDDAVPLRNRKAVRFRTKFLRYQRIIPRMHDHRATLHIFRRTL